jgi:Flp pilus assembly protein TadG
MSISMLRRLAHDRGGNFGIMTAVLLPVLLGAAGMALDVTNAMERKGRIQALADSAALAAASAMAGSEQSMTDAEAEEMAKSYFIGQALQDYEEAGASEEEIAELRLGLSAATSVKATTIKKSNTAESYEVRMSANVDVALNGMTSLLGLKTMKVAIDSYAQSGREGNALSMYLVLDESGSMAYDTTTVNPAQPTKQVQKDRDVEKSRQETYNCGSTYRPRYCTRTVYYKEKEYYYVTETNYITKMASLKAAAATMFNELKKADPTNELIRLGAGSYTHQTMTQEAMSWGTAKVASYVKKLPDTPAGGTDASGAMTNALNALKTSNATEKSAQNGKNNTSFARFIVLMTDGEMTGFSNKWDESIDKKVRNLCNQAKADKDANGNGIKIYTIAFMAPEKGKALLGNCASGDDYYYQPNDMNSLVQTFGDIARKAAATGTRLTN